MACCLERSPLVVWRCGEWLGGYCTDPSKRRHARTHEVGVSPGEMCDVLQEFGARGC